MPRRTSFYPLPPSIYPRPIIDPCPVYETTFAHEHGHHPDRDREFFRSRTFNEETSGLGFSNTPANGTIQGYKSIYPRHGTGTYTLPYFRRDSKGFRKPYTQPSKVDMNYLRMADYRKSRSINLSADANWAHPRSRPNFRDTYPSHNTRTQATGRPMTSSPAASLGVGPGLTDSRTSMTSAPSSLFDRGPDLTSTIRGVSAADVSRARAIEEENQRRTRAGVLLGDPLLANPVENAYRKSRTVYKRAFGQCR